MRDSLEMSGEPPAAPAPSGRRLEGRHVLMALLAFFGVVFAVNGWFLASALSTYTGLVAIEPYRKGLAYNARIAADERQAGWLGAIEVTRDGAVDASISDAAGGVIGGLHVTGSIGRPSTAAHDHALRLTETSPGRYAGTVGQLAAGSWIVALEARTTPSDAEPVYRMRRRLWLKP